MSTIRRLLGHGSRPAGSAGLRQFSRTGRTRRCGCASACSAPGLILALILCGCTSHKAEPAPEEMTAAEVFSIRRFGANPNPPVLVAEGSPPLVHLFDAGGRIRIVDTTINRTVATTTAAPRSIIAIDEEAGILVGGTRLVAGPLPPDRHFQVWWDTRPPASQPVEP